MDHPESHGTQAIEPSVGDLLKLREFLDGVERLREKELKQLCRQMAQQLLVAYPAVVRWLSREAAANLAGCRQWNAEHIARGLREDLGLEPDAPSSHELSALEPNE
jgi:hypothetical protein